VIEGVGHRLVASVQRHVDRVAVCRAHQTLVAFEPALRVGGDDRFERVGVGPVVLRRDGRGEVVERRPARVVECDSGVVGEVPERAGDELRESTPALARQDASAGRTTVGTRLAREVAVGVTVVDVGRHRLPVGRGGPKRRRLSRRCRVDRCHCRT
jgi:hypothetical protein